MASPWWSLYISLLCCFLFCSSNLASCLQNKTDRLALISFKKSIQRDPFGVLNSWNDSLHLCNWYGVSCSRRNPDRIIALSLTSQGLAGQLSPHIGNLSFLKHINFGSNNFDYQIPQEIGRLRRLQYINLSNNSFKGNIPSNVSHCSNLIYLNFGDNQLAGDIPGELGTLSKLEFLSLTKNNLTGSIPASFGNLTSLRKISLKRNGLQGRIPEEISQLSNLENIIFSNNFLIGEIPPGLYNISSIVEIGVDFNQLHGVIPSDIGLTLPYVTQLVFSYNSFSGPLPISLSNASKLNEIVFSGNHHTGVIPRDLGKLPDLQILEFHLNQIKDDLSFIDSLTNCSKLEDIGVDTNFLRGPIPKSVANLSKQMQVLDLSINELHGTIPEGIENLFNLKSIQLHENHLTGPIRINFDKFHKLEGLSLYQNKLTGTIPPSVGNLSMLSYLYLDFNNLNGSIPPSLGSCSYLIELYLSCNSLTGSIPKEVISLSSLSISLNLAGNALSGPIPSEVGLLQNLAQLDLSDNRLSGTIPASIDKCSSLEQLFLQGNLFEGNIPQAFSALQGLQQLDISANNFSGPIPESLADLKGLNLLNLSFNLLQGRVPEHGIFLNASGVSLSGNSGLCGGIKELKINPCPLPKSKTKNISIAMKIVIPIVVFAVLLVCLLIFWLRKRKFREMNISLPSFEHQFLRISHAELVQATDGFSKANIIGVGSYGSVFKGILEQVGIQVAVKVLNLHQRGASKSFLSECQALGSIRHRNLLKLLSVCSSIDFEGNDFKALIYEFMPNGSLEKWLHTSCTEEEEEEEEEEDTNQGKSRNLRLIQRLNIAIDIATAIEYLHNGCSSAIIHGDLKPSNVLLDDEMTAHIGDFGLAKIVSPMHNEAPPNGSSSLAIKGSIGYIAPEYGMGDLASVEADIYSYGILLLEMFTGKKPTDESFRDDLSIHTSVEQSLPHGVMDIVDQRILSEDIGGSLKDCFISALRIGIACSKEQPRERMKMPNVISELQKIKRFVVSISEA